MKFPSCESRPELRYLFRQAKDKQVEAIKAEMSSDGAGRRRSASKSLAVRLSSLPDCQALRLPRAGEKRPLRVGSGNSQIHGSSVASGHRSSSRPAKSLLSWRSRSPRRLRTRCGRHVTTCRLSPAVQIAALNLSLGGQCS